MASTMVEEKKVEEKKAGPLFPEYREKAVIHYGDECQEKSMELFEAYGLPGGLLPLEGVVEAGWDEASGFVWMATQKKQQHHFKVADRLCAYAEVVSCFLETKRMRKITGVKAKDLLVWVPVNEIVVDDAQPPKIHFKSIVGLSRSFPPEQFGRGA